MSQRFGALYASGGDRADAYVMEKRDWLVAAACGAYDTKNPVRWSVNEHVSESAFESFSDNCQDIP